MSETLSLLLHISISLSLPISLSLSLSLPISISLSLSLPISRSFSLSLHFFLSLSLSLSVSPYLHLFKCLGPCKRLWCFEAPDERQRAGLSHTVDCNHSTLFTGRSQPPAALSRVQDLSPTPATLCSTGQPFIAPYVYGYFCKILTFMVISVRSLRSWLFL